MSFDDDIEFNENFLENTSTTISFNKSGLLKLTKALLKILYFDIL